MEYNTIQLYRLGVQGVQHIAKANNVRFFQKKIHVCSVFNTVIERMKAIFVQKLTLQMMHYHGVVIEEVPNPVIFFKYKVPYFFTSARIQVINTHGYKNIQRESVFDK